MKRKKIKIDRSLCEGCGLCVSACHESAIGLVDGKATMVNEAGCDGLGNCLPVCPTGAITFEETEEIINNNTLDNWPIQLKLVPTKTEHYEGAKLLIAADCTAFACKNFHDRITKDTILLIGCPKLDQIDYREKLTSILEENNIESVRVVKMEVPCCRGLQLAAEDAIKNSGKDFILDVETIKIAGD